MKKVILSLLAMLTMALTASAMSYEQARNEALFLTDKMAYELNLTDDQYEAAYEINLDYLMGVTSQYDVFGTYWERRNLDLSYILYSWQWDLFHAADYFFRPLYWNAGYWHFGIYARYPRRDYFYFGRPRFFATYRGGHSWRMNGDRSFYEGRIGHYRPDRPRDSHIGMRNGWDRGDYRGHRDNSSTHFGTNNRHDGSGRYGTDNRRDNQTGGQRGTQNGGQRGTQNGGQYGSQDRSNSNRGGGFGIDRGNRGGGSNRQGDDMYGTGGRQQQGGTMNRGSQSRQQGGSLGSNRNGNFGGSRSGSIGGNQGGTRGGGSRSGGNHGGGSSRGGGNFGGSRR